MSNRILQNDIMKNRSNNIDTELKKQTEGLTANQIRLLASIYAA
jgi:hypothetical protein